jgi:hypothetical protein
MRIQFLGETNRNKFRRFYTCTAAPHPLLPEGRGAVLGRTVCWDPLRFAGCLRFCGGTFGSKADWVISLRYILDGKFLLDVELVSTRMPQRASTKTLRSGTTLGKLGEPFTPFKSVCASVSSWTWAEFPRSDRYLKTYASA